jgi:glycosyltransferase involved in cell wall biosynthesis
VTGPATVLHVVDSDVFGGAEQAVVTLVSGLDATRFRSVVAHHHTAALEPLVRGARAAGATPLAAPALPPGIPGLRRIPAYRRLARGVRPDVVHLHLSWPLGCQYELLASAWARVPVVVATVQLYVELRLGRRVMRQQRLYTRAVDRYFAVSEATRRSLVADLGWPADKITVVHNAVAPTSVDPATTAAVRESLLGAADRPLVLVPARLHPQKGHEYLLRAAVLVPDAVFALAGDGPERNRLEALAADLGVAERVRFLGHRDDMAALVDAADAVALPSLWEGLPISLLEAMAAGTPVVATRIAGTDELVASGTNGLLVEPRDADALAGAIRTVLDDPTTAARLATEGRATVARAFSATSMCRRIADSYDELLAR